MSQITYDYLYIYIYHIYCKDSISVILHSIQCTNNNDLTIIVLFFGFMFNFAIFFILICLFKRKMATNTGITYPLKGKDGKTGMI